MSSTHTHTNTTVIYANPYLRCDECGGVALGYTVTPHPGMDGDHANWPCGHHAAITSDCPSWSPVNGCQCIEHLGHREHELAVADRVAEEEG